MKLFPTEFVVLSSYAPILSCCSPMAAFIRYPKEATT
jgi:hypothetical protein